MPSTVNINSVFSIAWSKVKEHFKVIFLSQLINIGSILGTSFLGGGFIMALSALLGDNSPITLLCSMIINIGSIVFGIRIGFGFLLQAFNILKHNTAKVEDIFSANRSMIGQGIGMQILLFLGCIGGFIVIGLTVFAIMLLIYSLGEQVQIIVGLSIGIPFAIVATRISARLSMISYAIVDGYEILDAIKHSWHITYGNVGSILLYGIISVVILLLGVLCFVIGLFWAWPTIVLSGTQLYLTLNTQRKDI